MTQKIPALLLRGDPSSSTGECGVNNEESVGKNHYTVTMTNSSKKFSTFYKFKIS
jgi:hypothetical protein